MGGGRPTGSDCRDSLGQRLWTGADGADRMMDYRSCGPLAHGTPEWEIFNVCDHC